MTQFRCFPLLACLLLLGACASQAHKFDPPSASAGNAPAQAPVRDDAGMTAQSAAAGAAATPDTLPATVTAAPADQTSAGAAAPTAAEGDFDALYGTTTPQTDANGAPAQPGAVPSYDPWEHYNRGMHRFNMAVDRGVARPLATAYTKVVPQPARLGVTNFFDNLGTPLTMVNQLLQGHPV
ncbi:MlaA family lipoprotein, partial [Xanthomonas fragariae]